MNSYTSPSEPTNCTQPPKGVHTDFQCVVSLLVGRRQPYTSMAPPEIVPGEYFLHALFPGGRCLSVENCSAALPVVCLSPRPIRREWLPVNISSPADVPPPSTRPPEPHRWDLAAPQTDAHAGAEGQVWQPLRTQGGASCFQWQCFFFFVCLFKENK